MIHILLVAVSQQIQQSPVRPQNPLISSNLLHSFQRILQKIRQLRFPLPKRLLNLPAFRLHRLQSLRLVLQMSNAPHPLVTILQHRVTLARNNATVFAADFQKRFPMFIAEKTAHRISAA